MPTVGGQIQPFNDYYNFTKKEVTAYVDERELPNAITGGLGINHNEDLRNGTHYVMMNSSSWKTNGKETKIPKFHDSAVEGYDYNVNGTTQGLAWWNKVCDTRSVPNYCTVKITKDYVNIKSWQIEGAKVMQNINGKDYEYAPPTNESQVSKILIDDFTLNLSDRA